MPVEILKPTDSFGAWIFECITGDPKAQSIKIDIPGTDLVDGAGERINAIFDLFELLKEMNLNMIKMNENIENIDKGIEKMNKNLENIGLGD